MNRTANLNKVWADTIIDELIHQQVRYFCLGYGSRSAPLALAVANHPLAQTKLHFDERGIAFHALGYSKATNRAAAIITTSGSAVGNLTPAIMEAFEDRIPLIVITADRPPEKRSIGSHQTSDQTKIFAAHAVWQMDFPAPDPFISLNYLHAIISQAVSEAHQKSGPVHINIMFRDPLYPSGADLGKPYQFKVHEEKRRGPIHLNSKIDFLHPRNRDQISSAFQEKEGLIIVGSMPPADSFQSVLHLAKKKGWPILADATSQIRSEGAHGEVIPYYDLALLNSVIEERLRPKVILHLGGRIISQNLMEWMKQIRPKVYMHVDRRNVHLNPLCEVTHQIASDPIDFCREAVKNMDIEYSEDYLAKWIDYTAIVKNKVETFFKRESAIGEMSVAYELANSINESDPIFVGNSMPARDLDALYFPNKNGGMVFANRGLAGIDGNIATTIGIAQGLASPVIAIMGDLTFMHDVNSLAQLSSCPYSIIFFVINNRGGGIFSFLPAALQEQQIFENYFVGKHHFEFKSFAESFQLSYFKPNSNEALQSAIKAAKKSNRSAIIEIQTDHEQNYKEHADLTAIIKKIEPKKRSILSLCYSAFAKGN
jgi:2-succinyl-5-enolpyruvyl-6-hydroxy-3-cyclohexene-1-carboxylate synthase